MDFSNRIPCSDENCTGTINENGYCGVCGKNSSEIIQWKSDESKLRQNIEDLDKSVPKEGAYVRMTQYGGGASENQIVANRNGYLRLGIEFLKAAFAEKIYIEKEYPDVIDVDLDYLLKEPSTLYFDRFERTEGTPSVFRKGSKKLKIVLIAIIIVLGGCVVLALIGATTVLRWLF